MRRGSPVAWGKKSRLAAALLCISFVNGCAVDPTTGQWSPKENFYSDDPCSNNARNIGLVVGGIVGAALGNKVKHSNTSRLLGAALGSAVGGLIGADIDRRRCELYKIAQKNKLDMQFEDIRLAQVQFNDDDPDMASPAPSRNESSPDSAVGLKVVLRDNNRQFASGSDSLSPEAAEYFEQIADQYSYAKQQNKLDSDSTDADMRAVESLKGRRILLIGHTDDTGSSALNADLSERRARTVAKVFESRGIPVEQLFFQGAGETLPIADNRTEEGRARNRRVEIIDLNNDEDLRAFLLNRRPNIGFYRSPSSTRADANASKPATAGKKATAEPARSPDATGGALATQKKSRRKAADSKALAKNTESIEPPVQAAPVAPKPEPTWDFGGQPAAERRTYVDLGKPLGDKRDFAFISVANADEPMAVSCMDDRPRVSHGVKSLKDGKEFATSEYLPGMYDSSWTTMSNGNLVALTHVAVLRDGGAPARRPQLLIYRNYDGNPNAHATYAVTPEVNTYRGERGLLYRVFIDGPVRCMDIVIRPKRRDEAPESNLFYPRGQTMYVAQINPKLAK